MWDGASDVLTGAPLCQVVAGFGDVSLWRNSGLYHGAPADQIRLAATGVSLPHWWDIPRAIASLMVIGRRIFFGSGHFGTVGYLSVNVFLKHVLQSQERKK